MSRLIWTISNTNAMNGESSTGSKLIYSDAAFVRAHDLKRHERTHGEQKPYRCVAEW